MSKSRLKKIVVLFLAGLLATSALTGCGQDEEYGSIGDAQIEEEEASPEKEDPPLFTKQKNPFSNYNYHTEKYQNAGFSFEVPDSWNRTVVNPSCIRYDVPSGDPIFPGAVIYVKCNYYYLAMPDDLDPFADNASEFSQYMSSYITGLPYSYRKGYDVWIKSYTASDEMTEPDFCSEEHAAALKVTKDVYLMDKVTADMYSRKGMDHVAGYFRWDTFPVMIETVVPTDWAEDAKSMISYMMSSVAPLKMQLSDMAGYDYRDISIKLPADFQPREKEGNIFTSPFTDTLATSGITVGLFRVDEDLDDLTPEYINDNYLYSMLSLMLEPGSLKDYSPMAGTYEYSGEQLADEKLAYSASVSLTTTLEDYEGAERPYGLGGSLGMDMFFVEKSDQLFLIAALYYPHQQDAAARVMKAAIQSLSIS